MKTLLLLTVCLFTLTAAQANPGLPPEPDSDKPRFQVVSGMIDHGSGPMPTFIRLDTYTGQTWQMQQVPLPGGAGFVNVWMPCQEMGGELYEAARAALQSGK